MDDQETVVVTLDGLRKLQNAVALLNSMIACNEPHSDTSRAAVREALT